jgi:acetyltransferase-like isoleucine patch superfamily enzyme
MHKENPVSKLSPAMWKNTDKYRGGHLIKVGWKMVWGAFLRYVVFQGNRNQYLRHLGVKLGPDCDILTSIKNFGTEPWLIEIGARVTITAGVMFLTHDGANRIFRDQIAGSTPWGNRFGTIQILDNCFIGVNSILMPGIRIGPNSIVGAGSMVNKDVPPNTVAAGVPVKPLCSLEDYIKQYQENMLPIQAKDRRALRQELTTKFWGEER